MCWQSPDELRRGNADVCFLDAAILRDARKRAPRDEVGTSGKILMVRSRQRVRAARGPMTGSAASRTMRPDVQLFDI
jgi:hypothetical protein